MEILDSLTSKKILSELFTMILKSPRVGKTGTVIFALPVFGIFSAKMELKLFQFSLIKMISTFEQFTEFNLSISKHH